MYTPKQLRAFKAALAKAGFTASTVGRHKTAAALGVSLSKAECILNELRGGAGKVTPKPTEAPKVSEEQTRTKDAWNINLKKTRISSLDDLIAAFRIDLAVWEVVEFRANKWEVGAADKIDGKLRGIVVEPLFQVSARMRPRRNIVDARAEIEALKAAYRATAAKVKRITPARVPTGNMLEVNIPDIHFGKLAWAKETGYENYDVPIASEIYRQAREAIIARSSALQYDEIVYVVGNDMLHTDDTEGRTTSGTQVTTDARFHKTFATARRIVTETIERLRAIAPVRVVMVSGNHDRLSVWHLGDSLECYFHGYEDVTIDNAPTARKYYQFGSVMIMWAHGDKGKKSITGLLMATERPEMFGATKFREIHTGHLHKTMVDETNGVRTRTFSALCAEDDWHAEMGFTGNTRSAEALQWNRTEGLIGTVVYNHISEAA